MKIKLSILVLVVAVFFISCNNPNPIDLSKNVVLRENWKLILNDSPEKLTGEIISQKEYSTQKWHNAVVPGTIAGSLVADSTIVDPYFGVNLKTIDSLQFTKPWWYRTTFILNQDDINKSISLRFNGINYRANLWINGKRVVDKDKLAGAFNIFTFKINDYVRNGENVIALEVWPPVPGDYTIGFVDWNPFAPDKNMGIFRDVIIEINGGIKMRSPFVQSKVDKKNLDAADLSLQVELENNTENPITGIVSVNYALGQLEQTVTVQGGEMLSCKFTPDQYPQLKVKNVKLWWPNGMGDPNLYDVDFKFIADNNVL
ncbi:MAG: beta galactosidase jelly roll domain-containing protein, partial [Draconibacterium sp.]|nr:beta galactosidase jelly roll domain-containing protein [Draconibacterium sp.]